MAATTSTTDLQSLGDPTDEALLDALERRYHERAVYTYSGCAAAQAPPS
jgi:myosin heavy subunit